MLSESESYVCTVSESDQELRLPSPDSSSSLLSIGSATPLSLKNEDVIDDDSVCEISAPVNHKTVRARRCPAIKVEGRYWSNNGHKATLGKTYYKCKGPGCVATMQLIRKGEIDVCKVNGTHNSACDEYVIQADKFSTPIDRAYNNKVKQMVKHTKARVVERQLFEEQWEKNIDPDVHNIKSKSAIKSMRFREAHGGKSELVVLREFYNKHFVRLYKLIPTVLLVAIHKELMDIAQTLLTRNRGIGFIDGTFSVCREREQLTTLMMLYTKGDHSIAIPFAFCIGPKGSKTYDVFLTEVVAASEGAFQPRAILGDFEIAFRNSCNAVLHCQYFGDLFHFLQANQRWLRSNKYGDIAAEVTIDLRTLFYQKTQVAFLRELEQFQLKWDNRCKPYITYFNMQWLNTIQHDLWAYYPRAALNIPTGDQAMESFNHTFKSIAKTDVRQRLDTLVSELYVHCEYWKDIIGNDELFERTIIDLTNKRKATTSSPESSLLLLSSSPLSSSSSSSSSPSSSSPSSSSPSSSSEISSPSPSSPSSSSSPSDSQSSSSSSSSTPPQSSLLLLSSSSSSSLSSSSSSSLSSSSSSSVSLFADNGPSELLLKHYYCVRCLTAKKNDMCSLQMCLTCCSWESSKCRLAKHNEAKGNNQENPHMTTLHEAITHYSNGNGISVQLRYGGGSKPGEWRAVVPVQWENTRRKSFRAIDTQDGITKHYILSFVTGVKL